ncbi:MAG: hypothetical protein RLZZ499_483 [Cyanobacteriota bacterium]|jgi:predicted nucleic acid-binding protein
MIIFLDTSILGLLANPNKKGEAADCEQWLLSLLSKGVSVLTSNICDYEVRRNLILESLRKPKVNSVDSLDELKDLITFLPISNVVKFGIKLLNQLQIPLIECNEFDAYETSFLDRIHCSLIFDKYSF